MSTYLAHCSALTHIAQKDGQLYSVQKQNILVSNFNVDVYKYNTYYNFSGDFRKKSHWYIHDRARNMCFKDKMTSNIR